VVSCSKIGVFLLSVKSFVDYVVSANSNPDRKRQRSGKASNVEAALTTWFIDARTRDIPISGPILEEKAKDLAQALQQPDFNATSGWLSRWKTRNNIVYKRLHGEKKDSDFTAARPPSL
jgi:hypothetical protein